MGEVPKIVLPHGGYKSLVVYKKSEVIFQGTVLFCRRFLPARGDRTVDQMIQAARSCKQNIAEGSAASGTSKETELKLTNVARATLDELIEDYRDWLISHNEAIWTTGDKRVKGVREYAIAHDDWADWKPIFEKREGAVLANAMLTLCNQATYLLDRMIAAQETDFKQHGGVRERMHAARTAARGEAWDKTLYSYLSAATTPSELAGREQAAKAQIARIVRQLREHKGWA